MPYRIDDVRAAQPSGVVLSAGAEPDDSPYRRCSKLHLVTTVWVDEWGRGEGGSEWDHDGVHGRRRGLALRRQRASRARTGVAVYKSFELTFRERMANVKC
jgi:hypothetical protein